jgi:circadian clock protein KaiC
MSNTALNKNQTSRLNSNVPGLDALLSGGFFKSGVYIVQGLPGSGKTILANQICYGHVAAGGVAVYTTLLAESHSRMLQHLQGMSFFDERALPDRLSYISAFHDLEAEGLKGLTNVLRREMRARKASVLVLDGLVAATEAAESDRELKKFVHELQTNAAFLDCTIFLLTSGNIQRMNAEHTMVDGLIELEERLFDVRTERSIHVRKFRGACPVPGKHSFRISNQGIEIFPRLEAVYQRAPYADERPAALSSGIQSLDRLVKTEGFPGASATVVIGSTGTGKTTMALHFLRGASRQEPAVFFGFFESPQRLHEKARAFGWDFGAMQRDGVLAIDWHAPGEYIIDELGHRLLEQVDRMQAKRVVIDGLTGLAQTAVHTDRLGRFFSCLINELRRRGATVLMTLETRDVVSSTTSLPMGVSAFVDNLLYLRFAQDAGRLKRLLTITKMRDSHFESGIHEVLIGEKGMRIAALYEAGGDVIPSADRTFGDDPTQSGTQQ